MRRWIIVSGVSFLCAIGASVLFLIKGQKLFLPGSDKAILYLLILVPLALASALMLFKVMRSYANYTGTTQTHKLELTGPVVIFMLLICTGYYFYRHPPPSDYNVLTIHFYDIDNPAQQLQGSATITYKSDVRTYPVYSGTLSYAGVAPNTEIIISYDFPGLQRTVSDTFTVPGGNMTLPVPLKKNSALDIKKRELIGKFSTRLNSYYNTALNFSAFMEEDMELVFKGDDRYWDELIKRIESYNSSYDSLYVIKDSLTNALSVFLGTRTQEVTDLFDDFKHNHDKYFKSFNDDYRGDLIKFSQGDLGKARQKQIIDSAGKNGKEARTWLDRFQKQIDKVRNLISTT
jgi:hypothetical protein